MPSGKFINLRRKVFKESDLIIDSLNKNGEKFSFTAGNAIKSQRRFPGGVLEPLNFVELFYTQTRSGRFYLREARLIYDFYGLRQNYEKLEIGFHFLKLIASGSREGLSDNKALFDLLGNSLKTLEKIEAQKLSQSGFKIPVTSLKKGSENPDRIRLFKLHFEIKYLYYLGFLSPDTNTREFVNCPVNQYHQIELTGDEFISLNQLISHQLKNILNSNLPLQCTSNNA